MSNEPFFRQGQCNETSGFLFSHPCSEPSDHVCGECQKPVCGKHAVDTQGVLRCTTCAKTWFRSSGRGAAGAVGGGTGYDAPYYQSPYFYTWHHFGASHHHHHFHDGDEGALRGHEAGREDLDGFEQDMGAS